MPEADLSLEQVKAWMVNMAPQVRRLLGLPLLGLPLSGASEHPAAAHEALDRLLAEAFLHKSFVTRGSRSERSICNFLGCPQVGAPLDPCFFYWGALFFGRCVDRRTMSGWRGLGMPCWSRRPAGWSSGHTLQRTPTVFPSTAR